MLEQVIDKGAKIHFIGIGGVGMSSLAQYLLSKGYRITGSDLSVNSYIEKLMSLGVRIYIGHSIDNIEDDVSLVVSSSAVKSDNVEVVHAEKRNIPHIKRYQLLAYIVNNEKSIAVAGSHGKTTTTSMCASLLENAGFDPTAIIGGKFRNINNNVIIGKSDYFIVEADESDGGFLLLSPYIGVVTNIDNDHLGFYGNFENEKIAFYDFIGNSNFKILNYDDPFVRQWNGVNSRNKSNILTYSIKTKKADIYAYDIVLTNEGSIFNVKTPKRKMENLKIKILGKHNVSNALAVIGVAEILGVDEGNIRKTLIDFEGVDRRFTYIGNYNNLKVYDDYAHHPTEIRATISTAHLVSDNVYVIFQPHRFSRISYLIDEFSKSFKNVKRVFILDVYSASEKPIEGIDSVVLTEKINRLSSNAVYINDIENLKKHLDQIDENGVLVALGAGNVSSIIRKIVNDYKNSAA